jgi:CHAD domain-containing protein
MSAALRPGEPVMRGARRLVVETVGGAIRTLRRTSLTDESLHRVRKEMKRTRAGLRLLRDTLGKTAYERSNRSVRDAARPLTPVRDAKVLRDVLDDILRSADKSARNRFPSELRRVLQDQQRSSHDKLSHASVRTIGIRLQELEQRLQTLPGARLDHARADVALTRAYKKARKAFTLAGRKPSNERLHEWRKQVKYHLHQLEILQPLKRGRIGAIIKHAHKLADHLGDDHDLALLHETIVLHATQTSSEPSASAALIRELKRRRAKLQRMSYRLGKKLYADKPKRVARRARKYLETWQRLTVNTKTKAT